MFIIKPIKLDLQKCINLSFNGGFITKLVESSTNTEAVQCLTKDTTLFSTNLISSFKLGNKNIPLIERTQFHIALAKVNNYLENSAYNSAWKTASKIMISTLGLTPDRSGNVNVATTIRENEMLIPLNEYKAISYNMVPLYLKKIKIEIPSLKKTFLPLTPDYYFALKEHLPLIEKYLKNNLPFPKYLVSGDSAIIQFYDAKGKTAKLNFDDNIFKLYCNKHNITYYRILADPHCSIEEVILNKGILIPEGALIFCSSRGHVYEKINFYNRDGSLISSHFWDPVSEILLNVV
ncbi:MAG: hypothetical protein ACXW1A_00800 [Nitrososphaeraceae archaeon]